MLERHPVDYDALSKGQWLDEDMLDAAIPVKREHPLWSLHVAKLCADIERETGIVCCQTKGKLRLMEDAEADDYLARKVKNNVGRLVRDSRRTLLIDHSALDERQRRSAEARQRIAASTALVAMKTYREERKRLRSALPEDVDVLEETIQQE